MPNDQFDELESLLLDWEDGCLDDAGVSRLRSLLKSSEHARSHFVRLQLLNVALKVDEESGLAPLHSHYKPGSAPSKRLASKLDSDSISKQATSSNASNSLPRSRKWMYGLAAVLGCLLIGRLVQLELKPIPEQAVAVESKSEDKAESMSKGVAMVTQLVDATWDPDFESFEVGDPVPPGRISLLSGFAQVEFFCGATVIVEGPAELDLKSSLLARVRKGRLRAQVPPAARGFSLEVDDMKVVDLGTEFGLTVSEHGSSVQVFDGEVELRHDEKENQLISAGEAVTRTGKGRYESSKGDPEDFLDIASMESRAQGQHKQRFQRWQTWSEKLRQDKRLIAYYAFDQSGGWSRRLESSKLPLNSELDGAIVGANRVSGRWSGKAGLEFKRPGDRVRVQIPGKYDSLTFSCWVKIDSLDRRFNSLFLTDNYNKGEPHWQILENGQLYFSVRPSKRDQKGPTDYKALSPPFWNASLSGRWIHLGVVYNVESRTISHYFNGEQLSRDVLPKEKVVSTQIGAASIGNWSLPTLPDAEFAIRNLNGSIDEFAIFASALSAKEIKEFYVNGRQ